MPLFAHLVLLRRRKFEIKSQIVNTDRQDRRATSEIRANVRDDVVRAGFGGMCYACQKDEEHSAGHDTG